MNEITGSNARPIEVITQEIRFYKLQAGTSIIEIGRRLLEAKQMVQGYAFLPQFFLRPCRSYEQAVLLPCIFFQPVHSLYKLQAGTSIIEIGRRLLEAKQCLPHGKWGEWLQSEAEFSERTAQNFMRIAREYQNPQTLADMGNSASKALLLLSLPPEEREDFVAEAHEIGGESKTFLRFR